ncbi:MAG: orotidine-5'-phosphate decarboxylase [Planctomycetota bacterium]
MSDTPPADLFIDRLLDRIEATGAPVCIGLDPVVSRLPDWAKGADDAARVSAFCRGVIERTAGIAAAFKPQSACFERLGAAGLAALEEAVAFARDTGVPVVYDAKRGDIGSTAAHYAAAAVRLGADAITVNAYMGPSTARPYLAAGLGAFVLVRTSNDDSGAMQSRSLADGGVVADAMGRLVTDLAAMCVGVRGLSNVGAVVGLTKASEASHLRSIMPTSMFLVPGFGAQGGTADDLAPFLMDHGTPGRGVLINASRSIIYADDIEGASESMRDDVAEALS